MAAVPDSVQFVPAPSVRDALDRARALGGDEALDDLLNEALIHHFRAALLVPKGDVAAEVRRILGGAHAE